jgi:hypothetical protein
VYTLDRRARLLSPCFLRFLCFFDLCLGFDDLPFLDSIPPFVVDGLALPAPAKLAEEGNEKTGAVPIGP